MTRYQKYAEMFSTLANVTIHTNPNSSEAGHIFLFLYCDVIFSKSSARLRERLKLAFNSCARFIYSISRYEHISTYTNRILGVPLDMYYSMRIGCMINKIIKIGGPQYLFDELRFGQSSRLFNLLVPAHSLNARACSFFVQGTILKHGEV
jgi:hypothetical protein